VILSIQEPATAVGAGRLCCKIPDYPADQAAFSGIGMNSGERSETSSFDDRCSFCKKGRFRDEIKRYIADK
jgi:hypothetical protein